MAYNFRSYENDIYILYFIINDDDNTINTYLATILFSWIISKIFVRRLETFLSPVKWTQLLNSWWRNRDVEFPIYHSLRVSGGLNATTCKVKNGITSIWRGGEWNKVFSKFFINRRVLETQQGRCLVGAGRLLVNVFFYVPS